MCLKLSVSNCEEFYLLYAENGSFGVSSLCAVVVTVLCALNKRNLQMEAAATGRGPAFIFQQFL